MLLYSTVCRASLSAFFQSCRRTRPRITKAERLWMEGLVRPTPDRKAFHHTPYTCDRIAIFPLSWRKTKWQIFREQSSELWWTVLSNTVFQAVAKQHPATSGISKYGKYKLMLLCQFRDWMTNCPRLQAPPHPTVGPGREYKKMVIVMIEKVCVTGNFTSICGPNVNWWKISNFSQRHILLITNLPI